MIFKEKILYSIFWAVEKIRPNKCNCIKREQFFFRLKTLWFLVAFVTLSSHIKLASGEYKPPDNAVDSKNSFFQNDYKTCKKGLKLPGYSLNGGTKAGDYINLGSVNIFDECIDLCCQESDCEIAVMLTHKKQQKCFKVVCFKVDSDLCKPVHATKQKEKYHPYLFFRGGTKDLSKKEAQNASSMEKKSDRPKSVCRSYTGSVCSTHLDPTKMYIYSEDNNETSLEDHLRAPIQKISMTISKKCQSIALQAICYRIYPQCTDQDNPIPIKICENECNKISDGKCVAEFTATNMLSYLQRIIPNCQEPSDESEESSETSNCIKLSEEPYESSLVTQNKMLYSKEDLGQNLSQNFEIENKTGLIFEMQPNYTNFSLGPIVAVSSLFQESIPHALEQNFSALSTSAPILTVDTPLKNHLPTVVNVTEKDQINFQETVLTTTKVAAVTPNPPPPVLLEEIRVSAGDNTEIILPIEEASLYSSTWPKEKQEGEYSYKWSEVSSPPLSHGYIEGKNSKNVKLSKLNVPGVYTFKLEVESSDKRHGVGYINITVKEAPRVNRPPRADIFPKEQSITLPINTVVLDGSRSTDDVNIVSYKWELRKGPLNDNNVFDSTADTKILQLKNLLAGTYVFRLTVKDSDGETDSTETTITVNKEHNYPPKANAGSDVIIQLPNNSVVLRGDKSTDDKSILTYEWRKTSDSPTCDMQGSDKPLLHVSRLTVGTYVFILKVTDVEGLSDEAQVKVIVLAEHNTNPVAIAGDNLELVYPDDSTTLDGSLSRDNSMIVSYQWEVLSGPSLPKFVNADKPKVLVSDLKPGTYKMQLTVTDDKNLKGTDIVEIHVKKDHNEPPVANAGEDQVIYYPERFIALDGTKSHDDEFIVKYQWIRAGLSPAAGDVLNGSDKSPVLYLANLVLGRYLFDLVVTDNKGLTGRDSVVVLVNEDPKSDGLVEIYFDADVSSFMEDHKKQLLRQISVILEVGEDLVHLEGLRSVGYGNSIMLLIYVVDPKLERIMDGKYVADLLKLKVGFGGKLFDYTMEKVEPYICRNTCSGHGYCDKLTKQCVCDSFWTSNILKSHFGEKESNCEWSILYLSVAIFGVFLFFVAIAWGVCFVFARRQRNKRRTRYRALRTRDHDSKEDILLVPNGKGKYSAQSLTFTETDDDSEEETTVFDKKRLLNGNSFTSNGVANGKLPKQRDHAL